MTWCMKCLKFQITHLYFKTISNFFPIYMIQIFMCRYVYSCSCFFTKLYGTRHIVFIPMGFKYILYSHPSFSSFFHIDAYISYRVNYCNIISITYNIRIVSNSFSFYYFKKHKLFLLLQIVCIKFLPANFIIETSIVKNKTKKISWFPLYPNYI